MSLEDTYKINRNEFLMKVKKNVEDIISKIIYLNKEQRVFLLKTEYWQQIVPYRMHAPKDIRNTEG